MAESLINSERSLLRFAGQCDDAASGLLRFRESLPRHAPKLTGLIADLFAISSALRQIHKDNRSHGSSFPTIDESLVLVLKSLKFTLENGIFVMFASEQPPQVAWEDLNHRMESLERVDFLQRLELYRDTLDALAFSLRDGSEIPRDDVRQVQQLLETQQAAQRRSRRLSSLPGTATPRPRINRLNTPVSPTVVSDEWDKHATVDPPRFNGAPEPPLSPTYTSNSSHTMSSSQTSYGSDPYFPPPSEPLAHWAQDVYNGMNPLNRYRQIDSQLDDRSACYGTVEPEALHHLVRDGFQRAVELAFDAHRLWVRLYWRNSDHRARILVITKDSEGRRLLYCTPLTNLKIIRNKSVLQLCRCSRGDGRFSLWARLNFVFHERMVLFYCTFVAMKRQDERPVPHDDLLDRFDLEDDTCGEQELFAGQIQHGQMFHALRLWRDTSSNVVRLEASALRGPRKGVPIWTVFVTRYAHDPDWPQYEGQGLVSLAATTPPAAVFISRFEPPMKTSRKYVLPFTTDEDAEMFMDAWENLARTHGRHV
ncbi:Hypothetical predicted protein [Lecanosticta acicola]|uniref:PH domain-containing protein n=1 Tax=Lecanosticta acicola TaxID=111012 RepID=A0AAI9EC10_9PEZI|nr:Hypothetical predicted protein [Lecanosticta acicola]